MFASVSGGARKRQGGGAARGFRLTVSTGKAKRAASLVAGRLRRDITEPRFQRLRTAFEQRRVIHGVREHVLDVIAGFGERNGFSKNRALYRCAERGTPLRRASRTGVVTGGGQHGGIVELVIDHRQIIRAEQDVRIEVVHLLTRYRSDADLLDRNTTRLHSSH